MPAIPGSIPDEDVQANLEDGRDARDRRNVYLLAIENGNNTSYCGSTLIGP